MDSIENIQAAVENDLDELDDIGKYLYILNMGNELPAMDPKCRIDENLVKGCHSKVWLVKNWDNGRLSISLDSDTLIVRGLLAILYKLANGRTKEEIKCIKLFERDDLKYFFPESRGKGFLNMLNNL